MLTAYLNLTKPRISLLFAITGMTGMVMHGGLRPSNLAFWMVTFGIACISGCANALNQYFERDIDSKMARTAKKRPLPLGLLSARQAMTFAVTVGVIGHVALWQFGGWLATVIGTATIIFYSFYYTLWLKPRTPYNIVIGGAAGATAPLIGWAAASGSLTWTPWLLFLLIFMWTPPHFWALALCCKDDYHSAGYPMLPIARGDETTYRQIIWYSYTLLPICVALAWLHPLHIVTLIIGALLNILFIAGAWNLNRTRSTKAGWQLFAYSIAYLLLIFVLLIIDAL